MSEPSDLLKKPVLELARPRLLKAPIAGPIGPVPPVPQSEDAIEVFANLEKVADKAAALMTAVKKALATLSVPVRPEDREVFAAVLRKDPPSQGSYITFDLYLRALAFEVDAFDLAPGEVAIVLTGHQASDYSHLQALSLAKASNLSPEDARLATSQCMYQYILQLMQMGMQALETEKQTATKVLPPASEVPPASLSLLFSLAFQASYAANFIEDLQAVLRESASVANASVSGVNLDQAFEEAKTYKLPELRAIRLALASKDPGDFQLIRDYARAFVNRTRKVGYESWQLADEIFTMQVDLQRSLRQQDRYLNNGVPLNRDLSRLLKHRIKTYAAGLDYIATALTTTDSVDVSVCSLEWMANLSLAPLALLETCYEFLMGLKETFLNVQVVEAEVSLSTSVLEAILHEMAEVVIRVSKKLICWFQRDPEVWAQLERCPPIAEMINAALVGVEALEKYLFDLLESWLGRSRNVSNLINLKGSAVLEMKKLRIMLAKIQYIKTAVAQSKLSFQGLKVHTDLDRDIFGGLSKIEVTMKDKSSNISDFVVTSIQSDILVKNTLTSQTVKAPTGDVIDVVRDAIINAVSGDHTAVPFDCGCC